ncbi:MAG: M1 family metallopeptidase [Spirochaetales bacterium]|nr:M1 family metallopeptidase [Spirochaetales bacterium]
MGTRYRSRTSPAAQRPLAGLEARRVLLAICALGLLLGCVAAARGQCQSLEELASKDLAPFRPLWVEDELAEHPELAHATRYYLRLELAEDLRGASGCLRVRLTNRQTRALEEVPFLCFPNLTAGSLEITSVTVGGAPVQAELRRSQSLLAVPLPGGLAPAEHVEVDLEYTLRLPPPSSGERGVLGFREGVLSLAYAYPTIPALEAWDHPVPPRYGDFATNEAAFYLVEIWAPEDVTLVLPGIELDRRSVGGRTRVLFALGPARDLFLAAGRELIVMEQEHAGVRVRSAAPRGCEEGARLVLSASLAALESFGRRFGPYPFRTLTVAAAPFGALGMEFPGITLLSVRLYDLEGELHGVPHRVLLEATLAHELAHQWFYGSVGNDQLEEPWIDESLAQYASWLYYRDRRDEAGARGVFREFEERWELVDRAPIPIGRPVGAYTPREYSAIIYGRAPLFLHALSLHMGQERFDGFLARLAERYEWRLIDGEELRQLAEETCAFDLAPLWREWVD